jgi:hypothetical protein
VEPTRGNTLTAEQGAKSSSDSHRSFSSILHTSLTYAFSQKLPKQGFWHVPRLLHATLQHSLMLAHSYPQTTASAPLGLLPPLPPIDGVFPVHTHALVSTFPYSLFKKNNCTHYHQKLQ